MKTQDSDSIRWEDIVFESRNKSYGAYVIRNIYGKNVAVATLIALTIIGFVLAYPSISEYFRKDEEASEHELKSIKYTDLAPPPPIDKNVPPPPKLDVPPPVKTIIKFLPPEVTNKEVAEEEEMPTQEEVKQNDVGAENLEGTGEIQFDEPVEEVIKDEIDENAIFTVVEQQAEFAGGLEAMMKFIVKNMKYPAVARRMGVEGSVFVSFVVERDGSISEPKVIKGISAECDQEAVRVIKMMPQWKPGKQNGRPVRSRFVLPIKFRLSV
jgi:protein TonB